MPETAIGNACGAALRSADRRLARLPADRAVR